MTIEQLSSPDKGNSTKAASSLPILAFIEALKGAPAYLRPSPQDGGGWLVECPGCSASHPGGAVAALNQVSPKNPEIIARCYGGCDDVALVGALHMVGGEAPLVGANQWLERELARGHERAYLLELLRKNLPVPPELRAATFPKARTFEEFMMLKVKPRESLCGQWFRTGALAMLSGDSGAGKTWFCLDLALSVSTGVDFMKWSVPKARKVLLVSGEDDIDDLQERLPALLKAKSKAAGRKLSPMLSLLNANDLDLLPNGLPNLDTPEGRAKVEANLEGVSLVILDNYGALFNGTDENDAKAFAPTQDWLFWFKSRGISVLLVNHTGKNGDYRGTSKAIAGLNTAIIINQPSGWKACDGAAFNLTFKKSRDARGLEVAPFSARLGEDEEGGLCWLLGEVQSSPVIRPAPKTAEILELHAQGLSPRDIIEAGYKKAMVYAVLSSLKKSNPENPGVSPVQSSLVPPKGGVTRLDSGQTNEPQSSLVQSSPITRLDSKPARLAAEPKRGAPSGAVLPGPISPMTSDSLRGRSAGERRGLSGVVPLVSVEASPGKARSPV